MGKLAAKRAKKAEKRLRKMEKRIGTDYSALAHIVPGDEETSGKLTEVFLNMPLFSTLHPVDAIRQAVAAEREACARIADEYIVHPDAKRLQTATLIADGIRLRSLTWRPDSIERTAR